MASIKTATLTGNGHDLIIQERDGEKIIAEKRRFVHLINFNGGGQKNFGRYDIKGIDTEQINLGNLKLRQEVTHGENCYTRAETSMSQRERDSQKKSGYCGSCTLRLYGTCDFIETVEKEARAHDHEIEMYKTRQVKLGYHNKEFIITEGCGTRPNEQKEKREMEAFLLMQYGGQKATRYEMERMENAKIKIDFGQGGALEYLKNKTREARRKGKLAIKEFEEEKAELGRRLILVQNDKRQELAELEYDGRNMIEIMSEQIEVNEEEMKRRQDRKDRAKDRAIENKVRDINRKISDIKDIQDFMREIEETKGSSIYPLAKAKNNGTTGRLI